MASNMIQSANTALQKRTKPKTIQDYINDMAPGIKAALPSVMTPERFTRIALSAVSGNRKLAECDPGSFLGAMMTAAQLGLEPNTPLGQAYLIPYYNGKARRLECQFQLGYKGLIDLAYRSGDVSVIQAQVVYANDDFSYSFGLVPELKHIPTKGDRGEPVAVYAMFRTKDDGYGCEVMSMNDVRAHAKKYSKAYGNGPWQTNFEEMAKKTVLKRVLKYAPLKSDFVRGMAQDETIKTELSEDMYSVPGVVIEAEDVEYSDVDVDVSTGEVLGEFPASEMGA